MTQQRIILFGGGGHARIVIEAIQAMESVSIAGILDKDHDRWGDDLSGIPILGGDDELRPFIQQHSIDSFSVSIGAVWVIDVRRKLYEYATSFGLKPAEIIHPQAYLSPSATLGPGCQLLTRSIVNAGATLEQNVIVNTAAIVEHNCVVRAHSQLAPLACLAGAVVVGSECHIGMGVMVKEGVRIGDRCIIGAGAVVLDDVPDDSVVVGVPGRVIRRMNSQRNEERRSVA